MSESLAPLGSLLESLVARISAVEAQLGMSSSPVATPAGGQASAPVPKKAPVKEDPRAIRAYDEYTRENLDPFVAAAEKLGGHAVVLAEIVKEGWKAQRDFLLMATAVKEPAQAKLPPKLGAINATIQKANKAIQRNDFEFHAKTVAEGMQALTWVVVKPAPRDFIENFVGASDFWGNKIRVQHKKTAPDQIAFVDSFKKLIVELMPYVKEWHTTGVAWNSQGVDIDSYNPEAAAPTPAPSAPAPAPTPAPTAQATEAGGDGGKKALFGDLSKGLDITSGLKKVSKDQQTWRPEFKADDKSAPPPPQPGAKKPAMTGVTPKAAPVKGPPKCVYDGSAFRWNVENYVEGVHTVEVGEKNQSVYIYGCGNAIIDVRGKGKSVTLDNCKRTQVLVDEMLSSLEVVNCTGVKVQVRAKVPTVAIDKTDGIIVILSKDSLEAVITTSKSSEMNIQYPKNEDGELAEMPIPEQVEMDQELARVHLSGSLLASLIYESSRWDDNDAEGLLLGRGHESITVVTEDDNEATKKRTLETDISAFVSTGSRESFYDDEARVSEEKVEEAVGHLNTRGHELVGWYVARRKVPPRPSIRDFAVLQSMNESAGRIRKRLREREDPGVGEEKDSCMLSPSVEHPLVLLVLSVDLQPHHHTQTFEYACFYLPSGGSAGPLCPVTVRIRSLTHDSQAEYSSYTGSAFSPLYPQPSAADPTIPGAAAGLPVNAALASLLDHVPPPHVVEQELYMDQVVHRLRGLLHEVEEEEQAIRALEQRRDRLLQELAGP